MKGQPSEQLDVVGQRRRGSWPPVAGETRHAMPEPAVRDSPQ